ncbi:penicillin-binding protein 1B [Shewanella baltica]|uniref:Penicillin-binding protein 1B n=1 Tax=Shewanella baltica (strain OS195) TaxID=399599 RepID=A9L3T4_SHEB9|nr:penicillin-binding protein 1B [Shewanella baltica]ABX51028.1 penicillin-binding protein 1B [Shewanella baltica OS195]MCS6178732.1 penicillin-binding protein 1B [Shewanella baltica]MCS6254842.1 penicillin-binding protein 1B [Shewanella baltica]
MNDEVDMTTKTTKKTPASRRANNGRGLFRRMWSITWKLALAGLAVVTFYSIYLDQIIAQKFEGQKWHLPAQVFSRSMALYPGAAVSHPQMMAELKLLGYRKVANPRQVGEFSASSTRIELWRRPFLHPEGDQVEQRVMISFDSNGVSSVSRVSDKRQLAVFHLEPVLLDRIITGDGEDRLFVPTEEMPKSIVQALLLVEDRSFYEHHGVNPFAIARAAFVNISAGRTVQGGSTLTQQLAKNFFLSSERSLLRKVREALMAVIIDFRYSKDEILEAYLNEVYMGQDKSRAVHGMGLASRFYFGRPISELTIAQQAFLVAAIKGPSYYNPWRYPDRIQERRDLVLRLLMDAGDLTTAEYKAAVESPLAIRNLNKPAHQKLPSFFALVKQEVNERYGDALLKQSGVKIYTTLDPMAQEAAEIAVTQTLKSLDKSNKSLQVGMVVTDKYTGGIAAMVGDKTPGFDGFNRAVEIRRPIGSLIKPFVYATALAPNSQFTLATPLKDQPITLKSEQGKTWSPQNFDKKFSGQVPLLTALKKSMNVPTVNLGIAVGVDAVATTLAKSGWQEPLNEYPSMLLGAVNGSPLMVAQVYQTLADSGVYRKLTTVTAVLDADKNPLPVTRLPKEQAISPDTDFLIQYAMQQVVNTGTATRLGNAFPGVGLAGKTGTSNDSRDSWFAGFDERNVAAIWVGRDDNGKTSLYGSSGAMAVYLAFLKERPPISLRSIQVNGVVKGFFDRDTGVAKESDCSNVDALPALTATYRPVNNCGEPLQWWQKILGQ